MERLSTFDAGFLDAEDADRHISLAVGAVSILEGPMPDYREVESAIGERVLRVPRLRQVVHRHPLDLTAPEWADDPAIDLAHHIHRAALPHPGDDAAVFRFVAEAMEARLDRDRPLWQCWIIEGLAENRWAVLMKVHHCIADGIATMHLLAGLADGGEGHTYVDRIQGAHPTSRTGGESHTASLWNPLRWINTAWGTASAVTKTVAVTAEGALEIVDGLVRAGTGSPLVGPVSTLRRYSAVEVPLADVAAIGDAFGVTVNDVALAAITDSFRAALLRRGQQPRRDSLRTLVPVSVRTGDAMDSVDNRVSVMLPYLPVDQSDRVEQLRAVHRRLTKVKSGGQREAGRVAVSALKLAPFAFTSWLVRAVTSLPQRGVVTLATNVPGPRERLQILGHDVVRLLPIPPMALRLRSAVAILSYDDRLAFGITTDFDAVPDVAELTFGVRKAVAALLAAARRSRQAPTPL
ncbi:wax ester/triacylglycerol synthase family O-acyltransferase [Mycobacterium sp. WMMD1722]|uniref:wax ester/triacylglycerol synthase family O-acyltransferase n=1 Tax=Mycobacterium sp. WMMD1722 TaxID=3404117 RepID=UPI003BF4DEC5